MRVYVYEPWRQVDGLPPVLYSKEIDDPQPRLMVQPPLPLPATIPSPPPDTVPGWGYTSEIGVLSPPPALPLPTPGVTVDQALPWRADYGYPGVAGPVYASTPWSNCGCNSCSERRRRQRGEAAYGSIDSITMDLTLSATLDRRPQWTPLPGIDLADTSGIPSTIPVDPPARISPEIAEALRTPLLAYSGMPTARALLPPQMPPEPPAPVELELKTYPHKKAGKVVYVYQPVGMLSKGALTMAMATELALDAQKEAQ